MCLNHRDISINTCINKVLNFRGVAAVTWGNFDKTFLIWFNTFWIFK